MTDPRLALGREGERRAARLLERAGYRILARNARGAGVELDLVARRGNVLVVVEVKARSGGAYGAPEEAVDRHKQARLVRGAQGWLREARPRGVRRIRFDVVSCVRRSDGRWQLRHFEGAFDASP